MLPSLVDHRKAYLPLECYHSRVMSHPHQRGAPPFLGDPHSWGRRMLPHVRHSFWKLGCSLKLTFLPKYSGPDPSSHSRRVVSWDDSMKSHSLQTYQLCFDINPSSGTLHYPIKRCCRLPTSTWHNGHLNCGYVELGIAIGRLIRLSSTQQSQCSKQGLH